MSWLSAARNYAAFGVAIPRFVKKRPSLEGARTLLKHQLATRDGRFLEMADKCIFGYLQSPYLPLLKKAGCELGDLHSMVGRDGLEPTLKSLRADGVCFTFEEFKERSEEFDNPRTVRHFKHGSGGSTGPRTRTWMSLDHREPQVAVNLLTLAANGLLGVPFAKWGRADPGSFAITLIHAIGGEQLDKWFAPRGGRDAAQALAYGLARRLIFLSARLGGLRLPKLEWIDPSDGLPPARWAEQTLKVWGKCVIRGPVSAAVRVASAASENDIDLNGTTFMVSAEPSTAAKVKEITKSGARHIPSYGISEVGRVGSGCLNPVDVNDVHFQTNSLALIQHPRGVPGSDLVVDAFNFTTLSAFAPKVFLNVESDDFGILERRSCGCPLEELGFEYHIREIFSFRKLTGEGVTLVGSAMVRILEEVLPARFGGTPLDYQLIEEEDSESLTRLSLIIHPRVRIDDEALVLETVFKELKSSYGAIRMAGTIWANAQTIRVKRKEPVMTYRGKLLPLHTSRTPR